jgi:hypothetical protein
MLLFNKNACPGTIQFIFATNYIIIVWPGIREIQTYFES